MLDYIFRRKKWKGNTKAEKISLFLNMIFVGIYLFASALGLLWGITGGVDTAFGQGLYDVTLVLLGFNWIVALIATIGSFVLRKKGKIKASILINVIGLGYMIILFVISYLTEFLNKIPVKGMYTYALYCNHWLVNYVIREYFPGHSFYPTLIIYILISFVLSIITTHLINFLGKLINKRVIDV